MTEIDEVARLLDRVIKSSASLAKAAEVREEWARVVGERATEIGGAVSQTASVAHLMATTLTAVLEQTQTLVNDAQILSHDFGEVLELLDTMNQESKSATKSLKLSSDQLGQVTLELKANVIDRMRHDSEALTEALTRLPRTLDKSVSDAAASFERAASDALRQPVKLLMEQTTAVLRRIDEQNQAIKQVKTVIDDQNRVIKQVNSQVSDLGKKVIVVEGKLEMASQKVDHLASERRKPFWARRTAKS